MYIHNYFNVVTYLNGTDIDPTTQINAYTGAFIFVLGSIFIGYFFNEIINFNQNMAKESQKKYEV